MSPDSSLSRKFVAGFALLTLCCALTAAAQSGRRLPKKAPTPTPTPEPAPVSPKPAQKPKPALTLIVAMGTPDIFASLTSTGQILMNVSDRLDDSGSVKVEQVQRDLTHGEAVRLARSEAEAYVVLLEFRADSMSRSDNPEFYIQYWVFSPTTAKVKTTGRTYPQSYRNKSILNPRKPSIYGDYQLQQAAREAAERILDAFKLPVQERFLVSQK